MLMWGNIWCYWLVNSPEWPPSPHVRGCYGDRQLWEIAAGCPDKHTPALRTRRRSWSLTKHFNDKTPVCLCVFYLGTGGCSPERCHVGGVWCKAAGYQSRGRNLLPGWAAATRGYSWTWGDDTTRTKYRPESLQQDLNVYCTPVTNHLLTTPSALEIVSYQVMNICCSLKSTSLDHVCPVSQKLDQWFLTLVLIG